MLVTAFLVHGAGDRSFLEALYARSLTEDEWDESMTDSSFPRLAIERVVQHVSQRATRPSTVEQALEELKLAKVRTLTFNSEAQELDLIQGVKAAVAPWVQQLAPHASSPDALATLRAALCALVDQDARLAFASRSSRRRARSAARGRRRRRRRSGRARMARHRIVRREAKGGRKTSWSLTRTRSMR